MVRLFILLAAVALVLLILALISALAAQRVRNLPRAVWILVILLIPIAGPAAYFAWGRPAAGGSRRAPARPSSPDDDPEFLRSMDVEQSLRERDMLAQWEHELDPKRDQIRDQARDQARDPARDQDEPRPEEPRQPEENGQPDGEQSDEKKP